MSWLMGACHFPTLVAKQQSPSPYRLGYWCCASPLFVHTMQMAVPRAAISFPLGNGGQHLCGHHTCVPHLNFL